MDTIEFENKQIGRFYTKRWVCEAMLDIVDYVPSKRLCELLIIEPSCGDGSFLECISNAFQNPRCYTKIPRKNWQALYARTI